MQSFASQYQLFVPFSLCTDPSPPPLRKNQGRGVCKPLKFWSGETIFLNLYKIIPIQTPTFPERRGICTQATSIFKDAKRNSGLDMPV